MFPPSRHNPFFDLNWRWRRATFLAGQAEPDWHEQDDAWVRRALTFAAALDRCRDTTDWERLAGEMPEVYQAYVLFNSADDPPLLRWVIEARILANEPFEDIGRKCGLLPGAVEASERLFFSVRERLHADSWVICRVVGPKAFYGMTEKDVDVWLKIVGYSAGPLALDSLLLHTSGFPRPETPAEIDEALARAAGTLFRWKRLLASHLLPVTPETALQVLQLSGHLQMIGGETRPEPEAGPVAAFVTKLLNDQVTRLPIGEQEPAFCVLANPDPVGRGEQRKAV
jgi:hypothetical protein